MTAIDSVAMLVRALPEPADFYRGRKRVGCELPDNILMFHRNTAAALKNPSIGKAFHQRHVLIVPLVGAGRVVTDMNSLALRPGLCALIPPFHFHHYTDFPEGKIEWWFITFAYANVAPQRGRPQALQIPAQLWPAFADMIREFGRSTDSTSADRMAWRLALLLDALNRGREESPVPAPRGSAEGLLVKVSALAVERLSDPISLDEIARKVGLSSSHLRQQFLRAAGVSLGRFLREFRLRHAAEILAAGRANVTEAAAICGWDTPYAFSRAFRNYWGRAPKSFALAQRQRR